MRLADIVTGHDYAVSIQPRQVETFYVDDPDALWGRKFVARWLIADVRERAISGCVRAVVLGIEETDTGRKVVRVEAVASKSRHREYVEDHLDGTKTLWSGIDVDEEESPVLEEVRFEALLAPQQVREDWTEALVRTEMSRLDWQLRSGVPER